LDVSNPILIIVTGRLLLVVVANNRSLAQLMPSGAVHPNTAAVDTGLRRYDENDGGVLKGKNC